MQNKEMKTFRAEIKTVSETDSVRAGEFIAVVAVFGNVDLGGDRILPGAFTNALARMKVNGDVLPIIWSHEWDNPDAHIGYASPDNITETDEGLLIKGVLDTDRMFAEQVHHLMLNRRVKEFSFGYFVTDSEIVDDPEHGKVRELKEIDIFEAGPTLLGMNPETRLVQAASALTEITDGKSVEDATLYPVTPRQIAIEDAIESIVETFGQFDQTTGPDGSHYADGSKNPFKNEGMQCASCIYYAGPRACEIVSGDIDPAGICKMWIIPADLMTANGTKSVALDEQTQIVTLETTETPDAVEVSGDTTESISTERLLLLVRPRNKE